MILLTEVSKNRNIFNCLHIFGCEVVNKSLLKHKWYTIKTRNCASKFQMLAFKTSNDLIFINDNYRPINFFSHQHFLTNVSMTFYILIIITIWPASFAECLQTSISIWIITLCIEHFSKLMMGTWHSVYCI